MDLRSWRAAGQGQPDVFFVRADHHVDQLLEADLRLPTQHPLGLAGIAVQVVDLGRPEVTRIDLDVLAPVEVQRAERDVQHLAHAVRLAGGDDVVVGRRVLQHHPHRLDVVAGKPPIPLGVEVAEVELLVEPMPDARGSPGDLPGDERDPTARRLVIEQDAAADEHPVRFAVVLAELVGEDLGASVRAARLERSRLALRRLGAAEHLAGRGLVEPDALVEARLPNRLQQAQRAQRDRGGRVLGNVEADAHVALRAKVVDLVRLDSAQRSVQRAGVIQVAVDEPQAIVGHVRILIDAVQALRVERARAPDDAVDLVPLRQKELRQIRPVLAADSRD